RLALGLPERQAPRTDTRPKLPIRDSQWTKRQHDLPSRFHFEPGAHESFRLEPSPGKSVRVYLTIFFGTLSTVFVPVPEEAALLGAGYAVRLGDASLAGCLAATWLAVMIGDAF